MNPKPYFDEDGYLRIQFGTDEVGTFRNHYALHRLVALAAGYSVSEVFGDGMVSHHKNDDRLDNRTENIELMSRGEHSSLHTEDRCVTDEKSRDPEVLDRLFNERGLTGYEIAQELDCSKSTVYRRLEEFDIGERYDT